MSKGANRRPASRAFGTPAAAALAGLGAVLGWQLGALAIGVSVGASLLALGLIRLAGPTASEAESDAELRAHLARARRREQGTDVLVVRLPEEAMSEAQLLKASLRVTDSAYIARTGRGLELRAMVDRERLDRLALEQRLRSLATEQLRIGWSQFPENGFTLPVLLQAAGQDCHQPADRPADRSPVPVALPVASSAAQAVAPAQAVASR